MLVLWVLLVVSRPCDVKLVRNKACLTISSRPVVAATESVPSLVDELLVAEAH